MNRPRIILASGSPQRKEILKRLGIDFGIEVSGVEEIVDGEPGEVVLENALLKARAVAERFENSIVIGCDTDVVLEDKVIGKPGTRVDAKEYMRRLSGRSHCVYSGLALVGPAVGEVRTGVSRSTVTFRDLSEPEIDRYLDSGEWQGRAGGYAIQGRGSALVSEVKGDISNVIGLPVGLLLDLAPELDL